MVQKVVAVPVKVTVSVFARAEVAVKTANKGRKLSRLNMICLKIKSIELCLF